jgi:hypothetical protein
MKLEKDMRNDWDTLLKASIIKTILTFILILPPLGLAQNLNLRLISMGSCKLVFEDRDNDLNVYDFGDNPAGLPEDQQKKWMRARSWMNHYSGEFRRELDPKSKNQLYLQAEGLQPLNNDSVIKAFIQYYSEDRRKVYRALEYEPYHDIFTSIDTTTGTFDYYGPKLGFEYGKKINSWLSLGSKLVYQLQDGLKRESSKAKIDGRMISGMIGAQIIPYHDISLALAFRPFTIQYRINANKSFLLDYPIIFKFFGDSLLVKNENVSTFKRTTRSEGYDSDVTLIYKISPGFIFAAKGGYHLESKNINEGISEGKLNIDDYGSWQKQGPWTQAMCRIKPNDGPLVFGFSFRWHKWENWARTPRFQTVFEEMNGEWTNYGAGLAFSPDFYPFTFGIEYHLKEFKEQKNNYYQSYHWERQNKVELLKFGAEFKTSERLSFRIGGGTGKVITEYHLSLAPVNVWQFSLGSSFVHENTELEFTGFYERQKPENQNITRQNLFIIIQFTQWI